MGECSGLLSRCMCKVRGTTKRLAQFRQLLTDFSKWRHVDSPSSLRLNRRVWIEVHAPTRDNPDIDSS